MVNNAWSGRYEWNVKFPFNTFLNNIHMQQAQEAAAESKSECTRCFRLKAERSVIKLELLKSLTQIVIV
ncbi:hypothetical protein D3C71_1882550 [compost metagenome]